VILLLLMYYSTL